MPRYLPTLLAALLLCFLTVKTIEGFRKLGKEPDHEFIGPGQYLLVTPVASDFTLWQASVASIGGVYRVNNSALPSGTVINVEHAGQIVPTRINARNRISGSNGEKVSVLLFTAPEPGEYLVKVSGFEERRNFSLTRGNGILPFFSAIGWGMLAGLSFVILLVLLILWKIGKFPKRPVPPVLAT